MDFGGPARRCRGINRGARRARKAQRVADVDYQHYKTAGIDLGVGYATPLMITSTGCVNAGTNGFSGGDAAVVYAALGGGPPLLLTSVNQGRISATGTVLGVFEQTASSLSIDYYPPLPADAEG
jgi:hypothetical protein